MFSSFHYYSYRGLASGGGGRVVTSAADQTDYHPVRQAVSAAYKPAVAVLL
jgi:hypothetical protein